MKKLSKFAGAVIFAAALVAVPVAGARSRTVRADGVAIDETNFPDPCFRGQVEEFDKDKDGYLSDAEIAEVKELSFYDDKYPRGAVKDVKGIEFFTELTHFTVIGGPTSMDLSKNTKLLYLRCDYCPLTELDLSNNTRLQFLNCTFSGLTSLDLSKNKSLRLLYCSATNLESLDLSNCPSLREVCANYNHKMTSLDLSNCPQLNYLECVGSSYTSLNVSGCTELTTLSCWKNNLTSLDASNCSSLRELNCSNNALTSLNVSGCTSLDTLNCENNKLTSLDVSGSGCEELYMLDCSNNKLTSLDLHSCTYLKILDCSKNRLDSLELGRKMSLRSLDCKDNYIETLDISNTGLISLAEKGFTLVDMRYYKANVESDPESEDPEDMFIFDAFTKLTPEYVEPIENPLKSPVAGFIERLYTVALNRESERDGKSYWVWEIKTGNKTGGDCARFFLLEAPEFMNRGLSVDDFVETLYKTFFDRASDAAGKKGWVDAINSGAMSRADVVNNFIESTEWCNVCATYGVRSGANWHKAEIASENAINFATRLYTCCLGREAEEAGLKYWSLALTNLEQTGCSAAKEFFTSAEFIGLKTSDEEYLRRLYKTFMDREPEASEVAYWAGEIAGGRQTRDSVLAFFGQSEEFTNVCKSYGIERGTI